MRKLLIILTAFISTLASAQTHYPIKNMLQAVGHPWDVVAAMGTSNADQKTFYLQNSIQGLKTTGLRIYNDTYASKDPGNLTYRLSPEQRGFKTVDALISLKKNIPGLNVLYCYQGQPTNIANEWSANNQSTNIYRHYGSDPYSSSSYNELAHDLAVITGAGGRNKNVQDYPLFVSPNWWEPAQVMYKGAAFIDMIEGGNEWDNPWGNSAPANGTQYAISWSRTYDSVKAVDPTMLVSTTGICNGDPQIITDAINWCKANRGGKLSWDFVQHHLYPWAWSMGLSGGLPPELSIIREAIPLVTACGTSPLIIGEWSYDINRDSPINAPAFSSYSAEKSRGILAIRCIILYSKIGVFAAFWYRLNQDYFTGDPLGGNFANDNNGTQFATSALRRQLDDSGHFVRTRVGDYYAQISAFGDYAWTSSDRDDSVQIHHLTAAGKPEMIAAWTVEKITPWTDWKGVSHPEYNERISQTYLPSGTIYRLNDDSSGVLAQEHHSPGQVTISSNPVFFIADPITAPLPVHFISFTAEKANQAAVLKWIVQDAGKIEVERSTDAISWTNLGEGILNKYVDMHPAPGRNYYRLKMADIDSKISYSPIRSLMFNGHTKAVLFNSIGQQLQQGWSEDVDRWKSALSPGVYLIQYDTYSEKFRKLP